MYNNNIPMTCIFNESCLGNNNNICFTIKCDFYAEL